jgi:hypothetical protein
MELSHVVLSLCAFLFGVFLSLSLLTQNKTRRAIFSVLFFFSVICYILAATVGLRLL